MYICISPGHLLAAGMQVRVSWVDAATKLVTSLANFFGVIEYSINTVLHQAFHQFSIPLCVYTLEHFISILTPENPDWCSQNVENPGIWSGKLSSSLVVNFRMLTIFSHCSPETGKGTGL